jgi:trimeric autotransporter adhesin
MVGVNAGMWTQSPVGYNTAIGYDALLGASAAGLGGGPGNTGYYNVAAGASALYSNTTGSYNTVTGTYSENRNTTGSGNVTSGYIALYDNTTGGANTGIGMEALYSNTTGNDNTAIGAYANVSSGTLSNATALGASATATASNSVRIGSSSVTSIGGYANWTNFSDGRYKKNIQSNVPGLAFINKLNPVTYTLDIDGIEAQLQKGSSPVPSGSPSLSNDAVMKQAMQDKSAVTYTGFVAQDVEKAADSLNFVFSGIDKPKDAAQSFYGLRYGDFVPPLVKAVQELSASSNSKDSVINAMQETVDSLRNAYGTLQAQINALKAMVQAQKSAASLDQNAPNPFIGATIIGYNIPQGASSAQMQISDVTGKVLAVIPLSGRGPGVITADVSGYAAGTYNYSLIVDGRLVSTRKMISVR